MPDGDRPAVAVDAGVVVGNAEVVQEAQHLDREGLVDLEKPDVRDAEAGVPERLFRGRDRPDAHDFGLDAGKGVADQAHFHREAQLGCGIGGREERRRRAVVQSGGVAGSDPAVGAEGGAQGGEVLKGGSRPGRFVHGVDRPALARLHGGHRRQVRLDLALAVGRRQLVLGGYGVGIGAVLGDGWKTVVQVLRGVAHVERCGIHQALGHEPWIGIGALAHRVVAHVLHAAGDHDVVGPESDAAGSGCHRGHCAGAHAVHCEARDSAREPGQQRGRAADGQALLAGLGGGGDGHFIDTVRGEGRVAAHQFTDALDHEVVGTGSGIDALFTCAAERCADAVHKNDVANGTGGSAAVSSAWAGLAHVILLIEALCRTHAAMPPPVDGEIVTASGSPEEFLSQAQKLYQEGHDEEALQLLRRVLTLEPTSAEAFLLIGRINQRLGDQQAAISALKTAIFWESRTIDAHVLLGRIFLEPGDRAQALSYARSAIQIDPNNQEAIALQRQVETGSK